MWNCGKLSAKFLVNSVRAIYTVGFLPFFLSFTRTTIKICLQKNSKSSKRGYLLAGSYYISTFLWLQGKHRMHVGSSLISTNVIDHKLNRFDKYRRTLSNQIKSLDGLNMNKNSDWANMFSILYMISVIFGK